MLKLPRLKNDQFDQVNRLANQLGIPLDQCPTCLNKAIQVEDGVYGFENGVYRYRGLTHECDCQEQMQLRKHYMLAAIPDQYMRLAWSDFRAGNEEMKDKVATYLDKWHSFKLHGMGLELASPNLGVGKTFAATYVGKELLKRGESVFFTTFLEIVSVLTRQHQHWEKLETRMYESTVLILDEIGSPDTAPQATLFSSKLEELIRNRTNYNRVNIITTNMTDEQMWETYPRTYSLLAPKVLRIVFEGGDARQEYLAEENLILALYEEVRPIT